HGISENANDANLCGSTVNMPISYAQRIDLFQPGRDARHPITIGSTAPASQRAIAVMRSSS
ncbi:hypothetical protein, partial [Citrobacter freundii]|uniref:hypothetical protein n=1 Tax=Citrobacter freundii TaxID=546 RepID=UPI0013D2C19D